MEHTHNNAYSLNNSLVCSECINKDDEGGNECFCSCHKALKNICIKCKRFHNI